MLSNCDKMGHIPPPTTNEWTQTHNIDDHQKNSMASSTGIRAMEKPGQELLQQQQQALNCPRCDSSNTKFCYYNNYSLSQPRHFCKACKRYWTRGGTLRNVPVGGGCRKNKRVKRPNIDTTPSSPSSNSNPPNNTIITSTTSNHVNPLFYGLPPSRNSCDVMSALQFPRFSSGYDLQPQMNNLGLVFSSEVMSSDNNGYRNGFISSNNNTFVSTYSSIFGSSTSTPSTPAMAPLLLQQKFMNGEMKEVPNNFQGLEGLQMEGNNCEGGVMGSKEVVKVEGQNRLDWNINGGASCQNQMDQHMDLLSHDPLLYWNTATAMGTWTDQRNLI
ncbi:hypothetical protein TanjilG_05551 [Lupinus angustifolius]|uniref:Dof zinc finger protein n=1 Tax=Lupinus angustifolius TaxID=3871 RepID=A0A1J7IC40_LUPAN|nr:PREDICTED: dof zinc finger protein DOF1.4-like [Lupinus angustifolius]OIW10403.1 hypothetical protein TanjilG_05551 [Lupinus angustifolius]